MAMHRTFIIGSIIGGAMLVFAGMAMPGAGFAATTAAATTATTAAKLQYGAWLPFWQAKVGQQDVAIHLASLNEVSPFSYEIGNNGALIDRLHIAGGAWDGWMSAVREMGVKIIPTIAWVASGGIEQLLSDA